MASSTPTSSRRVAHGLLIRNNPQTIVLGIRDSDYQLHLRVESPIPASENQLINGIIRARARRVDVVHTGGIYIEPVYGRPRSLQGRIITTDMVANTITVDCGCPFMCELVAGQKAADFCDRMLVRFDIERGALFEPLS